MRVIADLEVHSKYARAVSPSMNPQTIAEWAGKKGIGLVGTGDFTHPMWLRELEAGLEEAGEGIYKLKSKKDSPYFLLTSEVSCIYSHKGKTRRIHVLIYLPDFKKVKKFNSALTTRGANLFADGRPIMGLSLRDIADIALSVDPSAIVIPAHVWTPWFGFYGANGGYDHLDEAFGDLSKYIYAIETGLSSDPAMNWRISELLDRQIVSFGDAHSPAKLGREATVFDLKKITYKDLYKALANKSEEVNRIVYTIEFYPEEGKYHYTGHRNCHVVYSPNEARKLGLTCPVCGKTLTFGVMSRVEELAKEDVQVNTEVDSLGVRWFKDRNKKRPSYVMAVPLQEILAESLGVGISSQKVASAYEGLIGSLGSEFDILLSIPIAEIEAVAGVKTAEGIAKVRNGDIIIEPGYDGIFGKVKIWKEPEDSVEQKGIDQGALF